MKILLLDSSYPINTRNQRIIKSLGEMGRKVRFCTWNRDDRAVTEADKEEFIFNRSSAYGDQLGKLMLLKKYTAFYRQVLREYQPDCIIASHWDMLFIAALYKPKHTRLIYENLDIPTAESKYLLKFLQQIEKWSLKKTDAIIFASRFFMPLYNHFARPKVIIENKPSLLVLHPPMKRSEDRKFRVVYVGLLRYYDILQNLIDAVKALENVELYFYGEGQDYDKIVNYAGKDPRIKFYGRYEYKEVGKFYQEADVVWAAYPTKDFNVKYAISNKFFESIVFRVPCIFAEKTELGKYVTDNKLGIIIDPYSVMQIKTLISTLSHDNTRLMEIKNNLEALSGEDNYWEHEVRHIMAVL